MANIWQEANDYADWMGEGKYDEPACVHGNRGECDECDAANVDDISEDQDDPGLVDDCSDRAHIEWQHAAMDPRR